MDKCLIFYPVTISAIPCQHQCNVYSLTFGRKLFPYSGVRIVSLKCSSFRRLVISLLFPTGYSFAYTNWAPGEPRASATSAQCLLVDARLNFTWVAQPCDRNQYFLCQRGILVVYTYTHIHIYIYVMHYSANETNL